MSKRKGIHDVVKKGEDVKKITAAIARGIDPTDIEEELRALGLKIRLDTVDWNTFGTLSIEGGENETGCIITLRLDRIEVGFDSLSVGEQRYPRPEVETVEELDALPEGSVVRHVAEERTENEDGTWEQGAVAEKRTDAAGQPAWFMVGKHLGYRSRQADLLPAVVLYRGGE